MHKQFLDYGRKASLRFPLWGALVIHQAISALAVRLKTSWQRIVGPNESALSALSAKK